MTQACDNYDLTISKKEDLDSLPASSWKAI